MFVVSATLPSNAYPHTDLNISFSLKEGNKGISIIG